MSEVSIPVATMVGAELSHDSIKTLSDSYREFCEDDEEYENSISPIEQDPEPYANGTKKTRPILKKYAQALLDKIILDQQLEAQAEAQRDVNLTPQQVKADMKIYVSSCEKKIAQQQEQCDALQKQVEQLTDVIKCLVTHPMFDCDFTRDAGPRQNTRFIGKNGHGDIIRCEASIMRARTIVAPMREPISLLTHSIEKNMPNVQDFLLEQDIQCDGKIILENVNDPQFKIKELSSLHFAVYKNDLECVKKLLMCGSNINAMSILIKHKMSYTKEEIEEIKTPTTVLCIATKNCSLEMVKFLHEKGATIGDTQYHVPTGPEGDLVAGYLQTHGSKPVTRF